MSGFLNMDDEDGPKDANNPTNLGSGLKNRPSKPVRPEIDRAAIAEAGRAHGFDRPTGSPDSSIVSRLGRRKKRKSKDYWRVSIDNDVRDAITEICRTEDIPIGDFIAELYELYGKRLL